MCKGGNVFIGLSWIIITDKWKVTNSKGLSWQLDSWDEDDEKNNSLSENVWVSCYLMQTM